MDRLNKSGLPDKEDEIDADMNNPQKREEIKADAIKTGRSKESRYYNLPFDEQMYDDLRIEEAKPEAPADHKPHVVCKLFFTLFLISMIIISLKIKKIAALYMQALSGGSEISFKGNGGCSAF